MRAFAQRLAKELDSQGTVDVLRHGIVYAGQEKAGFRLASGLNADLEAKYQDNRLPVRAVTRHVRGRVAAAA